MTKQQVNKITLWAFAIYFVGFLVVMYCYDAGLINFMFETHKSPFANMLIALGKSIGFVTPFGIFGILLCNNTTP